MFKGKIYCSECNKKHKYKKRAKKPVYVCSTYDNYGSDKCYRNQIDEEKVIWLISGHFNIKSEEVTAEFVDKHVDKIIATPNRHKVEVFYKDGKQSILSPCKIIR